MGRHVSYERRRSLRGRLFLALVAIAGLMCAAAFAAYQIWGLSRDHSPPWRSPAAASATPAASVTPATPVTLALTVTGAKCQVFVSVPGGDILVNRSLARGESIRLDEPRLSVILSDASAARVYVNGKPRPSGKPGTRVTFNALKG